MSISVRNSPLLVPESLEGWRWETEMTGEFLLGFVRDLMGNLGGELVRLCIKGSINKE